MKLVFYFISASALFTAGAIPMQLGQGSSSMNPNHKPKVVLGDTNMYHSDKKAAKDAILDHHIALEPGNDQKNARLAFVKKGWRDDTGTDDTHKQYLDFSYHRGETSDSAKIGQTVTVSRDRPPPEPRYANTIPKEHKPELAKETYKKYLTLPPEEAKRVRSMKIHGDWGEGSGLREEAKFTYHHGSTPRPFNAIGDPVTIYRPMSFHMDSAVPKKDVPAIKTRIRQEYDNLGRNHPLKQANFGVVTQGWHAGATVNSQIAGATVNSQIAGAAVNGQIASATMYKVKDQLSDSSEEDFKRIGDFHVSMHGGPEADGPSTGSKRKRPS